MTNIIAIKDYSFSEIIKKNRDILLRNVEVNPSIKKDDDWWDEDLDDDNCCVKDCKKEKSK